MHALPKYGSLDYQDNVPGSGDKKVYTGFNTVIKIVIEIVIKNYFRM